MYEIPKEWQFLLYGSVLVTGNPGTGKTALLTLLGVNSLTGTVGYDLHQECCQRVYYYNNKYGLKIPLPKQSPVYSNFNIEVLNGYNKYARSFEVDGFEVALENKDFDTINLLPCSRVYLTENQQYYDSHKKYLHDAVNAIWQKRRHFKIVFGLDGQRGMLTHKNIRDIINYYLELYEVNVYYDEVALVEKTEFQFLFFDSVHDYHKHINGEVINSDIQTLTVEGNIFNCFNSLCYDVAFLSKGKYRLQHHSDPTEAIKDVNKIKQLYTSTAPQKFFKN